MKKLGVLLAVLLALTGQGAAVPVRHLEYAFAIYPTAVPNNGYYNGTMSVDILGSAPDGGTLIRASDWWYYTPRPREAVQCEVYAAGNVYCEDALPSKAALALLPLLARDFLNGSSAASASSWKQTYTVSYSKSLCVAAISVDLSAMPLSAGRVLMGTSKGALSQCDGAGPYALEEGDFVYDRTSSIPLIVHATGGHLPTNSVYTQTSVELRLTKDSSATDASETAGLPVVRFQVTGRPGFP